MHLILWGNLAVHPAIFEGFQRGLVLGDHFSNRKSGSATIDHIFLVPWCRESFRIIGLSNYSTAGKLDDVGIHALDHLALPVRDTRLPGRDNAPSASVAIAARFPSARPGRKTNTQAPA